MYEAIETALNIGHLSIWEQLFCFLLMGAVTTIFVAVLVVLCSPSLWGE